MPDQDNARREPATPPPPAPASARGACGNCGSPLLGEYCYACGQPVTGMVRHFSTILGDFTDTVLNWDTRLPRTLWPLLARPGFLTREYFAGRRVRYVSPVRLFVTLAIVTFFVAQLMLSFGDNVNFDDRPVDASFSQVQTVEEVIRQRDEALADLAEARKGDGADVPGLGAGLGIAEQAIRNSADARIRVLERREAKGAKSGSSASAAPASADAGDPAGAKPGDGAGGREPGATGDDASAAATDPRVDVNADDDENTLSFNGEPWDPVTNPLTVGWWPDFANRWLNAQVGRGKKNIERMRTDQEFFKDAYLGAMPATLFVLLPVFALMLKIAYIFKRRLYMEHLLVALHSHAFLCLALLLVFLVMALQRWLAPEAGALHTMFTWIEGLLWCWMPIYLLLMQKHAYGQGWIMTFLKYSVLGFCYVVLLSFGAAFAALFAVVYA
ncbi:DUF3667 domain-containing protein [Luteimonas soli]|uniref:DUF3667 domain-containing protein n=1 Tax=Luteimonas soli TaxID=1648966 RepID=A0ABV7XM30_9GAMM